MSLDWIRNLHEINAQYNYESAGKSGRAYYSVNLFARVWQIEKLPPQSPSSQSLNAVMLFFLLLKLEAAWLRDVIGPLFVYISVLLPVCMVLP